jgi:hypothetical protein
MICNIDYTETEFYSFARIAMSKPPADQSIARVEPVGSLVQEFILPLRLLEAQNQKRKKTPAQYDRVIKEIHATMLRQVGFHARETPLPGRPQILCIRFSSKEPDPRADTFKQAIDRLPIYKARNVSVVRSGVRKVKPMKNRHLGFIVDDTRKLAATHDWWEPAPPGKGFGYIRIYTGEA